MAEQLSLLAPRPAAPVEKPQPAPLIEYDMGGAYTLDRGAPCVSCGRPTLVRVGLDGSRSADPRGVCGLRARCQLDPAEYDFEHGEIAHACWDCLYEHDREGEQRVLDRAAAKHGWRRTSPTAAIAPADPTLPTRTIGDDVLRVLSACEIDGDRVRLPGARLDRKLYVRVNEVLEALGGKWSKKAQAHVFAESPADVLDAAITSGRVVLPKDLGWFPTPAALARELVERADVRPGMLALEPSAGEGAIARELKAAGAHVHCYEIDYGRCETLRKSGINVTQGDFLEIDAPQMFDRVCMNPPFGKRADVAHVKRAFGKLHRGGRLVAIMSSGVKFRQDKLATEFRELVENSNGRIDDLPDGSFVESGTGVRTVVVEMWRAA